MQRIGSWFWGSIGFWGWYSFAYWASSRIYSVSAEVWWLNQFGFCAVSCLAIAFVLAYGNVSARSQRLIDWISLATSLIALATLYRSPISDVPELLLVACIAAVGFYMAWSAVRWSAHYACMDAKDNLVFVLVGVMVISTIKFVGYAAPPVLALLLHAAVLVAMTVAMRSLKPLRFTCEVTASPAPELYTGRTILSLWQTLLSIGLFFALWSFLNSGITFSVGHITRSADYSGLLVISSQVIDIAFSAFMLWWMLVRKRSIDWTLFWQIAYFVLALALLTMSLFGTTQVAQVFLSASAELVFLFLIYFLGRLGRRSVYGPALVVAVGYAIISLLDWAVRAVVSYGRVGIADGPQVSVFLFLILLTIVFFLPARSPGMQLLTSEFSHARRGVNLDSQRCAHLARVHGLSARELEVLVLLSKGRSTPYIAETLYLSENTVKTYRRRIYQKLDVHDKQELLDLVECDET